MPQPHFEIWIALTEMRKNNGGLWVVPGSHKVRQRHRFINSHMVAVDSDRYDAVDSGKVFIEADAGDVVIFSSLLLHKTYENTTERARWSYVAEVMKLGDFDPTIKPPYFVLARDGRSACEMATASTAPVIRCRSSRPAPRASPPFRRSAGPPPARGLEGAAETA